MATPGTRSTPAPWCAAQPSAWRPRVTTESRSSGPTPDAEWVGATVEEPVDRSFASVAERVRAHMDKLPGAERRVARALLAHYPTAGLDTAARLAEQAGTSTPTVVRFVARLGFDSYRDLQQTLRVEVDARTASPLTLPLSADVGTPAGLRARSVQSHVRSLQDTVAALPDAELAAAIGLLADPRRRIACLGGRFTHVMAEYLDLHLRLMRPGTRLLDLRTELMAAYLADAGRRDVCVIFDVRRYQREAVEFAHAVKARGAAVVLCTDPWLSPASEVADVVLPARVEGPSPFDSLVPMTALVETLVAGVLAALGRDAQRRMSLAEKFASDVTLR